MRIAQVLPVSRFTVTVLSSGIKASPTCRLSVCIRRRAVICNAFQGQLSQVPDRDREGECRGPPLHSIHPSISHLQLPLADDGVHQRAIGQCRSSPKPGFGLCFPADLQALGDEPAGWALHCDVDISTLCHASLSSHPDVDAWHHTSTVRGISYDNILSSYRRSQDGGIRETV